MVSNFMLIVFNHTTHVRPFGLLYLRSCLYMLSSSSQPRCFACVNLAYTRCMRTLESITPDHHVVLRDNDPSQRCTLRGIRSRNFKRDSSYYATVVLSNKMKNMINITMQSYSDMIWPLSSLLFRSPSSGIA